MPPGRFGGNLDTRQLTVGSTLYLPVQVTGAMFSCGDAHAAQGDGEVCVTGIESPMDVTLRFSSRRGAASRRRSTAPRRHADAAGRPRRLLRDDRRRARPVRRRAGGGAGDGRPHRRAATTSTARDAYILASQVVDLKISEIVDAGQYVVSAVLPLAVFHSR